jgi:putative ABC transport system substrate-binding protein
MRLKKITLVLAAACLVVMVSMFSKTQKSALPLVAIANLGPHSSLDASIQGIKDELTQQGFIEHETVRYAVVDVGFDASLIPQMIAHLKSQHPQVMVVTTTPVAQYAKGTIKHIPLVYNVVTDPVAAGLIDKPNESLGNMTGSSDRQHLNVLLSFAKALIPQASRVGILYSTAEMNDLALVNMMKKAAQGAHMQVVAIPVDQTRDIPLLMQHFNQAVDLIYVGGSGTLQPTLPVIVSEGNKMKIPVFNLDEAAVKEHLVLASFGVNYHQVGVNAGKLVAGLLRGDPITALKPVYPKRRDYHGFMSRKNAAQFGIVVSLNRSDVTVVE